MVDKSEARKGGSLSAFEWMAQLHQCLNSENNNFIDPALPCPKHREAPNDSDSAALVPSLTHKAASPYIPLRMYEEQMRGVGLCCIFSPHSLMFFA